MDKIDNLTKIKELFNIPELANGFPSQSACISWANKVAPLLRFNQRYHPTFMHYSQFISLNLSSYTLEPAFRNMVSQVEMAINELEIDISNEANEIPKVPILQRNENIVDIKPNIYGIGLNFNELWRRITKWFKKWFKKS